MSVFISNVTLNVGVWGYTVQLFSGSTGLHKPIEVGSKDHVAMRVDIIEYKLHEV